MSESADRVRKERLILLVSSVLVLGVLNVQVVLKERLLAAGRTIYLPLAPVDPRSLMQGDYMVLRYAIAGDTSKALNGEPFGRVRRPVDVIAAVDARGVVTFSRVAKAGERPSGRGEVKLTLKPGKRGLRVGAESFFFQEGHRKEFEKAKYGELRITPSGKLLLVGLRDAELHALGPERW